MDFSRPASLALLAFALTCGVAAAQPTSDAAAPVAPTPNPQNMDEDQAEAASTPPADSALLPRPALPTMTPTVTPPASYDPLASTYARPSPVYGRAPVDTSGVPVHVDEAARTPDRPLTSYDMSYDARLRASSASAQGMLGPLDGSWRLSVVGAGDVFAFELVDRGGSVEGAWRDLRRSGLYASGFVDDIQRLGSTLTMRFLSSNGATVAVLSARPDGAWTGEFIDGNNRKTATLRRN